jgi:K(+)-stimulated pyrophosphate-energized sodium pump
MTALWVIIACGLLSIVYGIWATASVMKSDAGSAKMQEIAAAVREGAQAYLKRQYTTIGIVGIVIFIVVGYLLGWLVAVGFAIGAVLSGAAGFIGMNVSVRANVRTAQAAVKSLAGGLEIAFKAGAITGMLVAGLALLGVAVYYTVLTGHLGLAPNSRTVVDALVSAAASSPRAPMSAATWSARWKPASPRTIRATRRPSPTTWATMSATAPAWPPTCSKLMR